MSKQTDKNSEQENREQINENSEQENREQTNENLGQESRTQTDENSEQEKFSEDNKNIQEYALPFEKRRKSNKNRDKTKIESSAYDDLDDYIYQTPVKIRNSKHHHKHHHKKNKGWKKAIIITIIILLILILSAISALLIATNIGKGEMLDENKNAVITVPEEVENYENGKIITYKGKKYQLNENMTSILFMGVDEREFEEDDANYGTNGNADVIMLMTIDTETGKSNLISISRDTMAEIDVYSTEGKYTGTETSQVALAFSYGNGKETSCENEVKAVRRMFYNIPISSYLALDLDSIGTINDAVGGVTVTSPETIGPFKEGESVTLIGDMAETFVRTRNTAELDSNSKRMERQKIYLSGFFNKFIESTKNNIMTPVDLFNSASSYMVTNIDLSKVTYLSGLLMQKNFTDFNLQTIPGEIKQGEVYAEYYVDEDKFLEMFLDIYYTPIED